jgi:hypothetical protein
MLEVILIVGFGIVIYELVKIKALLTAVADKSIGAVTDNLRYFGTVLIAEKWKKLNDKADEGDMEAIRVLQKLDGIIDKRNDVNNM